MSERVCGAGDAETDGVRTCAEPNGVLDEPALNFRVERGHALVVERDLAADEHVEHDAEAPDVDLRAGVHARVEQLRRGEVERAAEGGQVRRGVVQVRQAKVDDFDVPRLGDQDVLDLEICGRATSAIRPATRAQRASIRRPPNDRWQRTK